WSRLFLKAPPPTPRYVLSLHDALPISCVGSTVRSTNSSRHSISTSPPRQRWRRSRPSSTPTRRWSNPSGRGVCPRVGRRPPRRRSEEHTSELQSRFELVCRLLLEKKKR